MISFIIVNYKTYNFTKQAILSVCTYMEEVDYEVILVDNASGDNSIEKLEIDFKKQILEDRVIIIKNALNRGFSYGNNAGLKIARGEYVVLLNSDAYLIDNSVLNAVKYLSEHREVGAVTARVVNQYGELDEACKRGFPTPLDSIVYYMRLGKLFPKLEVFNNYKLNHLSEDEIHSVDAISGAFMVLPKYVVDQVGFLDTRFFMYGEDLDWCYRIKEAGYMIHYNPQLGDVIHLKGRSSSRVKWRMTHAFFKSMIFFYQKHYRRHYGLFVSLLVYSGVWILFGFKMISNCLTRK